MVYTSISLEHYAIFLFDIENYVKRSTTFFSLNEGVVNSYPNLQV